MKKQEWVHIPNYLGYNALFNVKRGLLWKVITFQDNESSVNWIYENEQELKKSNVPCVSTHKKYPFVLFPIAIYNDLTLDKIQVLTNKASDVYATKWLNNQKLKRNFSSKESSLWRIADNRIDFPKRIDFIKVANPVCMVSIDDDYSVRTFEEFEQNAVVNILEPNTYTDTERKALVIEAYKFSIIEDNYGQ